MKDTTPKPDEAIVLLTPRDLSKGRPTVYIIPGEWRGAVKKFVDLEDFKGAMKVCEEKARVSFKILWWMREW